MNPSGQSEGWADALSHGCPLCDQTHHEVRQDFDHAAWQIHCAACGRYAITEEMLSRLYFQGLPPETKSQLSAVVRHHFDFTRTAETITARNYRDLASSAPGKNDVPSKIRYLLGYIAHRSHFPGERVILRPQTDYPVCFASGVDEFGFYAQHIKDAGLVDGQQSEGPPAEIVGQYQCWLTAKGWEEAQRVRTLDSRVAFVAMSFSKQGSYAPLLARAFDEAIRPAIENDAGYQKAVRVDREHFLGDIVFEIIARLKESRFVVADVTEHKQGVYFEAGYAMGMGLPVIWTCHKDDMDKAHFDIRNLNHIVWDDLGELRRSLASRILATIGSGRRPQIE